MKRVLQITNYMFPHIGGIEQVTRDIAISLKDKFDQRIICFNHEKGTKTDEVDGVLTTRVSCQIKISSQSIALSYNKQLKKILRDFNPDIVIFHYPNPYVAHFLCKYLCKKRFKFIVYWHLDITKQKVLGKFFSHQNKKILEFADKVISTSPNYIEGSPWLTKYKEKCISIPCCVDNKRLNYNQDDVSNAKMIKNNFSGKIICFSFGRHVEYKGLEYLIKASELLDENYVILIGGEGPLTQSLKKLAKSNDKVKFLGKLSDYDLKKYLLACDIFCFPSITKNEAFGIGLAEAMYYEKPAITFAIQGSGVNYVNINNITGIEVENRNYVSLCEAIQVLGRDAEKRVNFGVNAKKRVCQLFLQDKFEIQISSLCENLLKKDE